MSRTELPRARTSPHDVRRKNFTVRLRGIDPGEVRHFLTGLADELEGVQTQVAVLTQENQALRGQLDNARADIDATRSELNEARSELDGARSDPMENATDQAVSVLNQAQQLADSLIDEAMQSARDLLLTARSQQRDIMEQAKVTAKGAVSRATSIAERASNEDASGRDVEYIRMFAKVAQVQFQAVLDALNEQVSKLGEVGSGVEPLRAETRAADSA
jgi:DivIVA domain-containing protein